MEWFDKRKNKHEYRGSITTSTPSLEVRKLEQKVADLEKKISELEEIIKSFRIEGSCFYPRFIPGRQQ